MKIELAKEIKIPSAALGLSTIQKSHDLLVSCFDGSVLKLSPDNESWESIAKHSSYASGVGSCLHGKLAVSAGYDGIIQWHDLQIGKKISVEKIHDFWSWQMKVSPNTEWVASVTGQYKCGGYKYEPAPEKEPSIKVFDARTQKLAHSFPHLPPVLSVSFSPDSRHLAAANMMGDIKIWNIESGKCIREWNTPDFTSWGIIKSHHYIGGIFDLSFSPDSNRLITCGMGPMRDPMAGNGKQIWQEFDWSNDKPIKTREIEDSERGRGLMETLCFHPASKAFCMAGRMAQGNWNTALFSSETGKLIQGIDNKTRITRSAFSPDGKKLILAGAKSQGSPKKGKWSEFGRVLIYDVNDA